jgi:hypothetical protein
MTTKIEPPRTKGDTAFPPVLTCLADDAPVDLSVMESVVLRMEAGAETKHPAHTLSNQVTHKGELVPAFADEDVDTIGDWILKVLTVLPDGTRATFRGAVMQIVE